MAESFIRIAKNQLKTVRLLSNNHSFHNQNQSKSVASDFQQVKPNKHIHYNLHDFTYQIGKTLNSILTTVFSANKPQCRAETLSPASLFLAAVVRGTIREELDLRHVWLHVWLKDDMLRFLSLCCSPKSLPKLPPSDSRPVTGVTEDRSERLAAGGAARSPLGGYWIVCSS